MNWQGLKILSKAPKKKYVKKLLEYAAAVADCQKSTPKLLVTPISQQFPTDLQLSAQEAHLLIDALVALLRQVENRNEEQIKLILQGHLEEQLCEVVLDSLDKLKTGIQEHASSVVRQADRLVQFNWKLEMEVATDRGKVNTPIVELQLSKASACKIEDTTILMKGPEFDVFFKNLQKIKQQLSQLVSASEE